MEDSNIISPFVGKAYQMVNDPTTDGIIRWGRSNNSFLVVDPFDFSQRILPAYFKHANFSSFVRQLNAYGFKKVDPDRWEFANELFLRGQTHLLNRITRKRHRQSPNLCGDDRDILKDIEKLKQEQRAFNEELESMNKRLEITEKRPQKVMSFLCEIVEDPEMLSKMVDESERKQRLIMTEKKRRLGVEEDAGEGMETKVIPSIVHGFSPEKPSPGWLNERCVVDRPLIHQEHFGCGDMHDSFAARFGGGVGGFTTVSPVAKGIYGSDEGGNVDVVEASPPAYPFSLLGGYFY